MKADLLSLQAVLVAVGFFIAWALWRAAAGRLKLRRARRKEHALQHARTGRAATTGPSREI